MSNLYSLDEEKIIKLCQNLLFDKKDTTILLCLIIEELSIKQIADKLNVSEQTVSRRIRKIKNILKNK